MHDLVSSYLLKDILAFEGIRKSKKITDLLILIAHQIGKEVSHNELVTQLSMSKSSVEKYLNLLELSFIINNVRGLNRNLRKEVTKPSRYYFYDNGIRNALINNYNSLFYYIDDFIGSSSVFGTSFKKMLSVFSANQKSLLIPPETL